MAPQSLLERVEASMKLQSFLDIVRSSYEATSGSADAAGCQTALGDIKELAHDGVAIAPLKQSELKAFIRDAQKAEACAFTLAEYQALLETLTKYAALKARHNNGKRWGLGLGLSTAGAMALTAAVFTSAGLVLVAAPAGAAIGAVAVAADGAKSRKRDRRTAKQAGSSTGVTAAAAAEAPAGPAALEEEAAAVDTTTSNTPATEPKVEATAVEEPAAVAVPAAAATAAAAAAALVAPPAVPAPAVPAPAAAGSSGNSSPRGSNEAVGAVVEFMPAPAAAQGKPAVAAISTSAEQQSEEEQQDVPAPVQCDSPFTAASRDTGSGFAAADLAAAPLAVRTSSGGGVVLGSAPSFEASSAGGVAGLPPKPQKSKSLTKSVSKKLKKAFSLKDKDSSRKDTGVQRDADSDSPLAPPVPPVRKSGSFFRRSSDGIFRRSSSDMGEVEGVDGVERSKGSATIKKMVEGIRRSFSLDRPSLDLVAPKRARKEA